MHGRPSDGPGKMTLWKTDAAIPKDPTSPDGVVRLKPVLSLIGN